MVKKYKNILNLRVKYYYMNVWLKINMNNKLKWSEVN